ncbi:sigma-70 family RNA polymerase sigma factor [Luteimicrobium sp. DT211]|uniref:sigma-70 family RNA polymerase sigma factor n=1 Tax=Luteimicrobium sp. DT211 TaxID=3393412 RepID=UPI003CEC35D2
MRGWESELAGLVEHRGAALLRYATMLCGNGGEAEDLVQDAVVKVFSRLRGPAGRTAAHAEPGAVTLVTDTALTNLEGYVRRAILTGYLDTYRRRRRWAGIRHLSAGPDRVVGHEDGVGDRADVTAALASLTPMQRACVVLRFYSDLTVPQVATELGCAPGTVKRHLHDANTTLRGRLGALDDGPPDPTSPPPRSVLPTQPEGSAR